MIIRNSQPHPSVRRGETSSLSIESKLRRQTIEAGERYNVLLRIFLESSKKQNSRHLFV